MAKKPTSEEFSGRMTTASAASASRNGQSSGGRVGMSGWCTREK